MTRLSCLLLLLLLLAGCVTKPLIEVPATPPPPVKLKHTPRVALVLGGGGARGYAHIGVMKVLQDAGVPVDLVVGSSAGSVMGVLYADSGDAHRAAKIMLSADIFDFLDLQVVPFSAPITGNAFQRFLLKHLQAKRFRDLSIPLVAVATDLKSGKSVAISSGPIVPAVTASAAIPGAVNPIKLYGRLLTDGAVADPVPVDIAKTYHPKMIIAVDIANELPRKTGQGFLSVYQRSQDIIWEKLNKLSAKGADIIIRPHVGTIGTFDISEKKHLYKIGIAAAKAALPQILRKMRAKGIATFNL